MNLLVNYVAQPRRSSPLNLAVARVIVCFYAAWKVATYPFSGLRDLPESLFLSNPLAPQNNFLALPGDLLRWLPWEQATIVVCLSLVAIGWRTGFSACVAALLLAHLSGLNYLIVNEKTFLLTVYFLVLYGIYRAEDPLRLDSLRTPRRPPPSSSRTKDYPMSALRLFLIVFSLIYFFAGVAKWKGGGMSLAWADADNLRLILQHNALYHLHETPRAAAWLLRQDGLLAAAGLTTLLLEFGFFLAVLARAPIAPFVLGLCGMHLAIVATMHLNYFTDMAVFHALFLPWDDLAARCAPGRRLLARIQRPAVTSAVEVS